MVRLRRRVPKSVTSIVAMTSEQLVGLVAACVDVASEGKTKLPGRLPPSMGARHRMCAKMAAAVKAMGYLREFAYNHLLYPSASETRDVLQWLTGRLPRPEEDDAGAAGPSGPEAIAREAAIASLRAWSAQPEPAPGAMQRVRDASRAVLAEEEGGASAETRHRLLVAQARGSGKAVRAVPLRADASLASQVSDAQSLADSLLETAVVRRARAAAVAAAGGQDAAAEAEAAAFARTRALAARGFAVGAAAGGGACGEGEAAGVGGGLAVSGSGAGGFSGLGLAQLAAAVRASREDLGRNAFLLSAEFAQDRALVTDGTGAGEDDQDKGAGQGDRARTDEEVAADRAAELAAEEERRLAATSRAAAARAKRSATEDALLAELDRLAELRKRIAAAEAELALQQRALELAEGDHEAAADALRADVAERQARLTSLAEEWEAHRRPLVDAAAELRGSAARAEARAAELEEEAAALRGEMRSLADSVREREAEALALRRKEEALPKDAPSRREYVERILGIVKQSRKQEAEERSIARDIARVQAESGRLAGVLSRSRAATHDAIFEEVERNRASAPHREAARTFTSLQEAFAALLTALRDTAAADAELRDLALHVDSLKQRSAARNRDDVMRDLSLVSRAPTGALARHTLTAAPAVRRADATGFSRARSAPPDACVLPAPAACGPLPRSSRPRTRKWRLAYGQRVWHQSDQACAFSRRLPALAPQNRAISRTRNPAHSALPPAPAKCRGADDLGVAAAIECTPRTLPRARRPRLPKRRQLRLCRNSVASRLALPSAQPRPCT